MRVTWQQTNERRLLAGLMAVVFVGGALAVWVINDDAVSVRPVRRSAPLEDPGRTDLIPRRRVRVPESAFPQELVGEDPAAEKVGPVESLSLPSLRGNVVGPDGAPRPSTRVAVLAFDGDELEPRARAQVLTEESGEFAIPHESLPQGRMLVVAARRGLRPVSRTFSDVVSACSESVTLKLEDGIAIRGRLTCNGRPLAGYRVSLDAAPGVAGVFLDRRFNLFDDRVKELILCEGQLESKHANDTTDDDGAFELRGLRAGEYPIRVARGGTARLARDIEELKAPRIWLMDDEAFLVRAPDEQARIALESARALIRFDIPERPDSIVETALSTEGGRTATASIPAGAPLLVDLEPGRRHDISVKGVGLVATTLGLPPMAAGTSREFLVALETRAILEVEFDVRGADAAMAKAMRVVFQRVDDDRESPSPNSLWPRERAGRDSIHVEKADGVFLIRDPALESGRYELAAELPGTRCLATTITCSLPRSGRVVVPLDFRLGARLEVRALHPKKPGHYDIRWRLSDVAGVVVHEHAESLRTVLDGAIRSQRGVPREPVFESGRYRLEVDVNGKSVVMETLDLERGQTVTREFVVEPR